MNTKNAIDFLAELEANNDRDWFQKNKKRYESIKSEMLAFLGKIIPEIALFDPEVAAVQPKDCIFRIYRDVRFSNDKSPYKTHIGAFISKTGRKGNHPGYYIHIEPEQSFLAGGLYMPPPDLLKAVRNEIYFNADVFKAIINHPDFIKYFGKLDDFDKLTRHPKGFDPDWPDIDLLKYKSYVVSHYVKDETLKNTSPEVLILPVFKAMYPFNRFLQRARENMEE
jgi:uncharacterized protein (TIGR02453 family)